MSQPFGSVFVLAGAVGIAAALAPGAAAAQSSATEEASGLTEVIVSAQRRLESAQDVPISISAFSGAQLQAVGVQALPDLAQVTPGLQFQAIGATSVPFLRGVGSTTTSVGTESTVALVVDGVYMSSQGSSLMGLSNIESVEVDKGPQGTLFGRNATGGVIQVRTRKPSHDPKLDFALGAGNHDTYDAMLYGTTGLGSTLAADLALSANRQFEGYGRNLFDGSVIYESYDYAVRSKWLWTPSDATEVTLVLDYERLRSQTGFATRLPNAGELGLNQRGSGGFQYSGGFYDVNLNFPSFNITKTGGGSVDWLQHLSFATLRSISAYHRQDWEGHVDFDLGPNFGSHQDFKPTQKTFSQELQLLSPEESRLSWVLGAYYYHDVSGYHPVFIAYPAINAANFHSTTIDSEMKTDSWSLFGQTTVQLPWASRLTLGLRYTNDDRTVTIAQTTAAPPPASITQHGSKSFPKLTFRAALDHRFGESLLAYVQAARGFKSGFFNTQTLQSPPGQPTVPLEVNPETLDAYEAGIKSDWLGNRLRANASVFYYDYQDQQVNAFLGSTRTLLNAAASEIYGLDFELVTLPVENLTLSLVGEYLHARYSSFPNAPVFTANPAPGVGNIATPRDASGNTVVNSPTVTGTVAANYAIPLGAQRLELNANAYYNNGYYFDFANTRRQSAYTLLNASVKWMFGANTNYDVTLWGENLLGEEVYASVNQVGLGPGGLFGGDSLTPRPPRTYGVRFGAHF
jgi:iron complex outermembrane receptor protein